jgi:deoxyribonuclease V
LKRHRWDLTPAQAAALQARLAPGVIRRDRVGTVRRVAGLDVSFRGGTARAAAVVLSFPALEVLEERTAAVPIRFPYVPGLLSFREVPALLAVWRRLRTRPDLIFCDGHGWAHPRRFGLACHLGRWLNLPSIGCAKSRLIGTHAEPGPQRGAWTPLTDGEVVGAALRTRDRTRVMYVSIGHRVSLATAIRLTLACGGGVRVPEPTRRADLLTRRG